MTHHIALTTTTPMPPPRVTCEDCGGNGMAEIPGSARCRSRRPKEDCDGDCDGCGGVEACEACKGTGEVPDEARCCVDCLHDWAREREAVDCGRCAECAKLAIDNGEIAPPCAACNGTGNEDGLPSGTIERDFSPAVDPCPVCGGTGEADVAEVAAK